MRFSSSTSRQRMPAVRKGAANEEGRKEGDVGTQPGGGKQDTGQFPSHVVRLTVDYTSHSSPSSTRIHSWTGRTVVKMRDGTPNGSLIASAVSVGDKGAAGAVEA